MSRKTSFITGLTAIAILTLFSNQTAIGQTANVDIVISGCQVLVDDINFLQAKVSRSGIYTYTISASSDFLANGAALGFRLFSPDASISSVTYGGDGTPDSLTAWINAWNIVPAQIGLRSWDGNLPDSFITGGAANVGGFGPTGPLDIVDFSLTFSGTDGIFCVDTTFIPPAGDWLFAQPAGGGVVPTWGGGNGPYSADGYCVTLRFVNCPPQITCPPDFGGHLGVTLVSGLPVVTDPDIGDVHQFFLTSVNPSPAGSVTINPATGAVTMQITSSPPYFYDIGLGVTDGIDTSTCSISYELQFASPNDVQVNVGGPGVIGPDNTNGLSALVAPNTPITYTFRATWDISMMVASLGFRMYSPDASITTVTHISGPDTLPAWSNVFTPGGVQIDKRSYDGNLPDSFCITAGSISPLSPSALVDVLELTLSLSNSGIFCIDTTFIPPSCQWIFAGGGTVSPTWGGIGGYSANGYCVTVATASCDFHKPGYRDYAIYGMPDFDQKLDIWRDTFGSGNFSHCGPVAMANCLWWFDSKFEPAPRDPRPFYPDTMFNWSDGYPLITSNAIPDWDDHDTTMPEDIIDALAICMGTNQGGKSGTSINNMQSCLNSWLISAGVRADFTDALIQFPNYTYIREKVLAGCNVILALGFYEDINGNCCRIGGHFVTLAGVSTTQPVICISDPFYDNLEPSHAPETHFDAAKISGPHGQIQHDAYIVAQAGLNCLPASAEALADYFNGDAYGNFFLQNDVEEGSPCVGQGGPIITVLEAALVICGTKPFCCVNPGDADGGGAVNIGDATHIVKYVFQSGTAPPCLDEGDADGYGSVNIGDATYIVKFVFQGGETPVCGTTGS